MCGLFSLKILMLVFVLGNRIGIGIGMSRMKKATEIIDNLLTGMTVREMAPKPPLFEMKHITDAQRCLGEDVWVIDALKYLKDNADTMTMAHADWIKREGI